MPALRKPRIDKVKSGKIVMPKGESAEEELRRIRRQARRRARAARSRGEQPGADVLDILQEGPDPQEGPPPVEMDGAPSAEELRNQFWGAFGELGGQAGLVQWGRKYPKEFYAIWARLCIPKATGEGPAPNSLESMLASLGDD